MKLKENLIIPVMVTVAREIEGYRQDLLHGRLKREEYRGFLKDSYAAGYITAELLADLEGELEAASLAGAA